MKAPRRDSSADVDRIDDADAPTASLHADSPSRTRNAGHRAMEALQRELARRLARRTSPSSRPRTRCDTRISPPRGLAAQARGEVGDGADRAVVDAPLEADAPMRREALRDADAHRQVVAALLPAVAQRARTSRCIASAMRAARGAGSATGTGSLKKTMMPSPAKRSSVPSCASDERAHRRVVFARARPSPPPARPSR